MYDPRITTAITSSIEHVHEVWAYNEATPEVMVRLDLVTAGVNYDAGRSPLVLLEGATQVPNQAVLDLLDPRQNVRILVKAGYRYGDGTIDLQPLCDLMLQKVVLRQPQNDLVITATSDEMRIQQYVSMSTWTWNSGSDGGQVISQLVREAVGQSTLITIAEVGGRSFVDAGETLVLAPGEDLWGMIQTIADRIGATVYHDGHGMWHVRAQTAYVGSAAAMLSIGRRQGTVVSTEAVYDRLDFANFVLVEYTGGDDRVYGFASQTTGDFGILAIGRVARVVTLSQTGSAAQATAAAQTMLWRAMRKGREVSIDSGAAMYWLRPDDTVTLALPNTPAQERHLISSVVFYLPEGTMNVHTRLPEKAI